MQSTTGHPLTFAELGLKPTLLTALLRLEHLTPTPIQAEAIPAVLAGRDILGQAQTGTGKTAAFALPILERLDRASNKVQAIVLVPTRELALQVAAAFENYAKDEGGVRVLAVYGGAPYATQLRQLSVGVHIVVGTPGRVLDHLGRGSLSLENVRFAVLDEADEMLRMGFVDDVEAILAKSPKARQTALFSATLPDEIARIAREHLRDPQRIAVRGTTRTVDTIRQDYVMVPTHLREEALARILMVVDFEAALVFARTKVGCATLAETLDARGLPSEALHGDLAQSARESVVRRLRRGQLRVVVATDVAARGLDVDLLDLVVNVELPMEASGYVHRIGRTGRAGRQGRAITIIGARDERRIRMLERFTGQRLNLMPMPSVRDVENARVSRFSARVEEIRTAEDLTLWREVLGKLRGDDRPLEDLAAALAKLAWGDRPAPALNLPEPAPEPAPRPAPRAATSSGDRREPVSARSDSRRPTAAGPRPGRRGEAQGPEMVRISLGVGSRNGVQPRDLVGAIANEGGVAGPAIGGIDIRESYSIVEVPKHLADQVLERMAKTRLRGRFLQPRVAPNK